MDKAELLESRTIHQGRVINLQVDRVRLPGGVTTELELVVHRGAAAIVPIDEQDQVWMVRQYRYATGGYILEVPAGTLDPGESPEACALREVQEEVGARAGELVPMGFIWTTPGFTNERIWLYAARKLQPVAQSLDRDEVLTVEKLPVAEAVRRAAQGEIEDAKSVCALLRLAAYI